MEKGIKKLELLSPWSQSPNFQPITDGHQIIHLSRDAALFREWWKAHDSLIKID